MAKYGRQYDKNVWIWWIRLILRNKTRIREHKKEKVLLKGEDRVPEDPTSCQNIVHSYDHDCNYVRNEVDDGGRTLF